WSVTPSKTRPPPGAPTSTTDRTITSPTTTTREATTATTTMSATPRLPPREAPAPPTVPPPPLDNNREKGSVQRYPVPSDSLDSVGTAVEISVRSDLYEGMEVVVMNMVEMWSVTPSKTRPPPGAPTSTTDRTITSPTTTTREATTATTTMSATPRLPPREAPAPPTVPPPPLDNNREKGSVQRYPVPSDSLDSVGTAVEISVRSDLYEGMEVVVMNMVEMVMGTVVVNGDRAVLGWYAVLISNRLPIAF
nr:hypothetical protein [Tanacetum cinerariifolium]